MGQESDKISHCYYVIYIEGLIAKLHTSGFSQKIVQLNITPANFHKSWIALWITNNNPKHIARGTIGTFKVNN